MLRRGGAEAGVLVFELCGVELELNGNGSVHRLIHDGRGVEFVSHFEFDRVYNFISVVVVVCLVSCRHLIILSKCRNKYRMKRVSEGKDKE